MVNKNFLLLSLEDDKIKKVSNVISNDSCRKILDYLSNKEATESEIAEKLQIPISTIHYNIQQLMETGLIDAKEFHYSEKGKRVNHYKLANKYIIIAPKKAFGIKEKLRSILPVALIVSAAALILQHFQKFFVQGGVTKTLTITQKIAESSPLVQEATSTAAKSVTQKAQQEAARSIPTAFQNITNKTTEYLLTPEVTTQTVKIPQSIWSNIALWFLLGALFGLIVYLIISSFRKDFSK